MLTVEACESPVPPDVTGSCRQLEGEGSGVGVQVSIQSRDVDAVGFGFLAHLDLAREHLRSVVVNVAQQDLQSARPAGWRNACTDTQIKTHIYNQLTALHSDQLEASGAAHSLWSRVHNRQQCGKLIFSLRFSHHRSAARISDHFSHSPAFCGRRAHAGIHAAY